MRGAIGSHIYTTLISILSTTSVSRVEDKCILTNPVISKVCPRGNMWIGIYNTERGRTEVGFEHDLATMKFRILTYHVEIKRI